MYSVLTEIWFFSYFGGRGSGGLNFLGKNDLDGAAGHLKLIVYAITV